MPKITAPTLEQHRSETIDRLLDAISELVMSRGYSAVSLADVAQQAGLARTAIYNYFPDRESLLFLWTEREVRRAIAVLEQEIAEAPTSAEKLKAFVRLQLHDFARRHLPPGQEVIQFLQPDTYGRFMQHIEPLEQILVGILRDGADTGEFGDHDPAAVVPMIMACIGAERGPIAARQHSVNDATERVTEFLLRALGSGNSRAPRKASKKKTAAKKKR
jgi:AcrR family transcriptional regulator